VVNGIAPGRLTAQGPWVTVAGRTPWRGALRRHLAWLMVAKFVALVLLWALFFSPAHRGAVDSLAAGQHLAVAAPAGPHD